MKSQPLLQSSCFGADEFTIQARGNASLGTLQSLGISICEEQMRIIAPFAYQDSANIFSFLCWIWIYLASDTLDKHYIHHLSCSLPSEKGTICLWNGLALGEGAAVASAGSYRCNMPPVESWELYGEICSAKDQVVLHWWGRVLGRRMKAGKVLHYITCCNPLHFSTILCNCRRIYHFGCCTTPEELYGPGPGWLAVKMLCVLLSCHDKSSGKRRKAEKKELEAYCCVAPPLPGLGGVSNSHSTLEAVSRHQRENNLFPTWDFVGIYLARSQMRLFWVLERKFLRLISCTVELDTSDYAELKWLLTWLMSLHHYLRTWDLHPQTVIQQDAGTTNLQMVNRDTGAAETYPKSEVDVMKKIA